MSLPVSQRVQRVKPSPTMAVTALAAELRAQGRDIIGLGSGEPDFDTPEHIKAAAIEAIASGQTKYTAVDGTPELKAAIIDKFERDNGLTYAPDQILVSSGAKQTCFNVCAAVLNAGDEAVIPAPYWVSYPDMVKLADGEPVIVSAGLDNGFKITPRGLAAAITERTRLVFLNSPCNPTGAAYTRSELAALGEIRQSGFLGYDRHIRCQPAESLDDNAIGRQVRLCERRLVILGLYIEVACVNFKDCFASLRGQLNNRVNQLCQIHPYILNQSAL